MAMSFRCVAHASRSRDPPPISTFRSQLLYWLRNRPFDDAEYLRRAGFLVRKLGGAHEADARLRGSSYLLAGFFHRMLHGEACLLVSAKPWRDCRHSGSSASLPVIPSASLRLVIGAQVS